MLSNETPLDPDFWHSDSSERYLGRVHRSTFNVTGEKCFLLVELKKEN